MKNQNHLIEGVTKRVVKKIIDQEVYGWPPQCATFYYQPVRPSKVKKEEPEKKKICNNVLCLLVS